MAENRYLPNSRVNEGITKKNAFDGYKIDSYEFLDELEGRTRCSECSKSRKFFCYTCYIPMPPLVGKLPKVELPLLIDIIKHPQEIDGKSTAVHAPILAPEHVRIHLYPDLPDTDDSILIFPSENAEVAEVFMQRVKSENDGQFPYKVTSSKAQWNRIAVLALPERKPHNSFSND